MKRADCRARAPHLAALASAMPQLPTEKPIRMNSTAARPGPSRDMIEDGVLISRPLAAATASEPGLSGESAQACPSIAVHHERAPSYAGPAVESYATVPSRQRAMRGSLHCGETCGSNRFTPRSALRRRSRDPWAFASASTASAASVGTCFAPASARSELEFVAVNDITDAKTLAHLLKYDSVHGTLDGERHAPTTGRAPRRRQDASRVLAERDPAKLPWKDLGVDLVLECSGLFTDATRPPKHLEAGAKKVHHLGAGEGRRRHDLLRRQPRRRTIPPKHHVISNASCTTNCLAPVAKVLHETFGIERGLMTTIHAYTNDQRILDLPHEDLRRARAAALSMIPTTTGAAQGARPRAAGARTASSTAWPSACRRRTSRSST